MLDTTEYTYKCDMLVHLRIGKNLGIRLNTRLRCVFKMDTALQNEQFFAKKHYNQGNSKSITKSTFEEKKKQFDMSETAVTREIVEEYAYTGEDGSPDELQIQVKVDGDEMIAVIDFKDESQLNNLVCPAWLIPPA